jgi:hypothetical protein
MADCKDIDTALGRLSLKIDGLSGKLNDLEKKQKECCDGKDFKNNNSKDLEPRVIALEQFANTVNTYVESLEKAIKTAASPLKEIVDFFNF